MRDKIKKYFRAGELYDVNIKYIDEKKPLGTAGALGLLKKQNNFPIVLCNGDVISNININNLLNFHKKNKAFATMAVIEYEHTNPFGVVTSKGFNLSKRTFISDTTYYEEENNRENRSVSNVSDKLK